MSTSNAAVSSFKILISAVNGENVNIQILIPESITNSEVKYGLG